MLAFSNANGLTGDLDGSDGTVSLTGSQSAINDALLNGVVYTPASNYNGCSELTVTVNDLGHSGSGGARSATECFDINIAPVNDAPEFTGHGQATFVAGGTTAVPILSDVAATDVDSANYDGGSFTAMVASGQGDELSIANDDFISVVSLGSGHVVMYDFDGDGDTCNAVAIGDIQNTGSLDTVSVSLNDHATDAAVEALAQAIQFGNGKSEPITGPRTVTFTLQDGDGIAHGGDDSGSFTATVNVAAANHAATFGGDTTGEVTEDDTAIASGSTTGHDVDSGVLTVQDADSGESHFLPIDEASLHGTYGDFTFDEVTGAWTYALVHDRVDGLAADEARCDTLTVSSADGTTQNITITVNGVNDAPVFTGHDLEPSYVATGQAAALVDDVSISDIDSADYAGGSLTATVTENVHDGDSLTIANGDNIFTFVSSGSHVMFDVDGVGQGAGAIEIGTLSGGGSSLTVTLNANADNAAVEALTEAIRFSSSDPTESARIVTITLNDGDGTTDGGHDFDYFEATVHVTPVPLPDQPLTVIGDMSVVAVKGGGEVAITIADLNAIDPDTSAADLVFTVDHLDHGRLAFGNDRMLLDEGDTFTLADVQAKLVYYQSVGNYVGQDNIALSLSDDAGTSATVMLGATIVDAQFTVLTTGGYDFAADDPLSAMGRGYVDSFISEYFHDHRRELESRIHLYRQRLRLRSRQ